MHSFSGTQTWVDFAGTVERRGYRLLAVPLVDLPALDQDILLVPLKVLGLVIPKRYLILKNSYHKVSKRISDTDAFITLTSSSSASTRKMSRFLYLFPDLLTPSNRFPTLLQ